MNDRAPVRAAEPQSARERILLAAFQEIHLHGFQGMRVDAVLDKTSLTKGAFYHHFSSKQALGLAVVDEMIYGRIHHIWLDTMSRSSDPVTAVQEALEKAAACYGMEMLTLGCPLNNLAQEMSPINEEFRLHINRIFHEWHQAIAGLIERGIAAGKVIPHVDPQSVAAFILATLEGCIGLAKNERAIAPFVRCVDEMERYLESLRPR
jgi:AcrR family transcriptional regulator